MLFFGFKNYEGFQEVFGVRECGNGQKSRRNKILLGLFKDRSFVKNFRQIRWHELSENPEGYIRHIRRLTTMADARDFIIKLMRYEKWPHNCYGDSSIHVYDCVLMKDDSGSTPYRFVSTRYELDGGGICYDGDYKSIRYRNVESDHIFKMKAGKFFRHIIEENEVGKILPEQIKVWLCEDFAERWQAYARAKCPDVTLHVGDSIEDFEAIYDSDRYDGSFGSCMASEGQYSFYADAVRAKAAWLEKEDGSIVARCVIFTHAKDEDGKTWRLAERQYSSNQENGLKRLLVDKLIASGEIDGYKQVGVDCHNGTAFVANDGTSLSDKSFRIDCRLEFGDTLSYQDSFKYFDFDAQIAYNQEDCAGNRYFNLDTTDHEFRGGGMWSDYNQEYIPEDDAYYDEEREDYFYDYQVRYCENTEDYRFRDDCVELAHGGYAYNGYNCEGYHDVYYCEECGDYFLEDDGCYSDITEEWYCCDSCRDCAEQSYMRRNSDSGRYAYDEVTEEWYEVDNAETVRVLVWDWEKGKRKNALTRLENKLCGRIFKYGKNWYYGNAYWNYERCIYEPLEKAAC